MDYADSAIKIRQLLRDAYNAANEKDYDQAERFGLLLVAESFAFLQDIKQKKN